MVGNREHIHEALRHYSNPGFLFAILVRQIELGEGVATRFRLSGQLDEKGREEVLDILLVKISIQSKKKYAIDANPASLRATMSWTIEELR